MYGGSLRSSGGISSLTLFSVRCAGTFSILLPIMASNDAWLNRASTLSTRQSGDGFSVTRQNWMIALGADAPRLKPWLSPRRFGTSPVCPDGSRSLAENFVAVFVVLIRTPS